MSWISAHKKTTTSKLQQYNSVFNGQGNAWSACVSYGSSGLGNRREEQMEAAPIWLAGPVVTQQWHITL